MKKLNRFFAAVRGDVVVELQGVAVFDYLRNENGDVVFGIRLRHDSTEGEGIHEITFSCKTNKLPKAGTYSLSGMRRRHMTAMYWIETEGGRCGSYAGESGKLTLSRIESREVVGSFVFRAPGTHNLDLLAVDGAVTVLGSFVAVPGNAWNGKGIFYDERALAIIAANEARRKPPRE